MKQSTFLKIHYMITKKCTEIISPKSNETWWNTIKDVFEIYIKYWAFAMKTERKLTQTLKTLCPILF